jgi:hypothetical protein
MANDPKPDAIDTPPSVPVLLGRIEQHLARIADALEAMVAPPVDFTKDLGPTRTMPKPVRR